METQTYLSDPSEKAAISEMLPLIEEALHHHDVVIVVGGTGSGKSTHIPSLAMRMGCFRRILHTQPRRVAVTSLAERIRKIAPEAWQARIAWQTRFERDQPPNWGYKLMTEGILVQQLTTNPLLQGVDLLILDEVHERSLHLDLLMGWLKSKVIPQKKLKLLLTSATLEASRLADYFQSAAWIEVPSRTYPISTLYQPVEAGEGDPVRALVASIRFLDEESKGDILIFLPGAREIFELSSKLQNEFPQKTILPLYGRGSKRDQQEAFKLSDKPRLILATNVAETSLTLPTVCHVIDLGWVKVSHQQPKSGRLQLRLERISQASAEQRKGRCGRLRPGICIRLYDEALLSAQPLHTPPEIQRHNLSALVLRLTHLSSESPEHFPFLDAPDPRKLKRASESLKSWGAIALKSDDSKKLCVTALGSRLLKLPMEPAWGRALLEAERLGLLSEMAVVLGGMGCDGLLEVPWNLRDLARQRRAAWHHPRSDFLTFLKLWNHLHPLSKKGPRSAFDQACEALLISRSHWRRWQQGVEQLHDVLHLKAHATRSPCDADFPYDLFHTILLQMLPEQLAQWDPDLEAYRMMGGAVVAIHPTSGQLKSRSPWILASGWLETSRIWAIGVAQISPSLLESALRSRMTARLGEAYWDEEAGCLKIERRWLLFGWVVDRNRPIEAAEIDPEGAALAFIDRFLIAREAPESLLNCFEFLRSNHRFQSRMHEIEVKTRTKRWRLRDQDQHAWYAARLPKTLTHPRLLATFLKKNPTQASALQWQFDPVWQQHQALAEAEAATHPDIWIFNGTSHPILYQEAEGLEGAAGATVALSEARAKASLDPNWPLAMSWGVEGMRVALVVALLKTLGRANFSEEGRRVWAERFVQHHQPPDPKLGISIDQSMAAVLRREQGIECFAEDFQWGAISPALQLKAAWRGEEGWLTRPEGWKAWLERLRGQPQTPKRFHLSWGEIPLEASDHLWQRWRLSGMEGRSQGNLLMMAEGAPPQSSSLDPPHPIAPSLETLPLFFRRWIDSPPDPRLRSILGSWCGDRSGVTPTTLCQKLRHYWLLRAPWPSTATGSEDQLRHLRSVWDRFTFFLASIQKSHQGWLEAWHRAQQSEMRAVVEVATELGDWWQNRWQGSWGYLTLPERQRPRLSIYLQAMMARLKWAGRAQHAAASQAWQASLQWGNQAYRRAMEQLRSEKSPQEADRIQALIDWYGLWEEHQMAIWMPRELQPPVISRQRLEKIWHRWMEGRQLGHSKPSTPSPAKVSDLQWSRLQAWSKQSR